MYFSVSSSQHADVHKAVSGSVRAQDDATEDHDHDQGDLLDVSIKVFFSSFSLFTRFFLKELAGLRKVFFSLQAKNFILKNCSGYN